MSSFFFYAVVGAVAGAIAGLFGIGGGLLMVPALVWTFQTKQLSPEISVHLAIGTSLAVIVVSSLSSIVAHQRKGVILWSVVRQLVPGLVCGSLLGVWVAQQLSSAWLGRGVGMFMLSVALQMAFLQSQPAVTKSDSALSCKILKMFGMGIVIGGLSAMVGIGGGSLTVPFLARQQLRMQSVVGTAAVCGLPIALAGAIGFILAGQNVTYLPDGSMGYVYLPAVGGMALFSLLTAPLGAAWAHRLKDLQLRRGFSILLFLMGVKMLMI